MERGHAVGSEVDHLLVASKTGGGAVLATARVLAIIAEAERLLAGPWPPLD
ncbi:hypothetical protein ACFU6I_42970 [Streptomyces sp. NPDC057486]|uniref:hypothetical protein n=1 Tax=Streptomyces sp. NPDC057486 TaxID=3346145 RepID=UPI0036A7BEFB